jgi:hypothetical protein
MITGNLLQSHQPEEAPIYETPRLWRTLTAGTRLTLVSDDKPDRFFTAIKFWNGCNLGCCT